MTEVVALEAGPVDTAALAVAEGAVAVLVDESDGLDPAARALDRRMKGALTRAVQSPAFAKLKPGEALTLGFPAGIAADSVIAVRLPRKPAAGEARKAGAAIAAAANGKALTVLVASRREAPEIALGLMLRTYAFTDHKTADRDPARPARLMAARPDDLAAALPGLRARAEGVFLARDLVNEPANVLTTTEFARRLEGLRADGIEVEVLDEDELRNLGMRTLLAVGQGSSSPSKVVVMQWRGGSEGDVPLALVGKGVCFDSGGLSMKPAAGMEDMTMDMGGAATVAGVMQTLARRKAKANVVGLVGLVENMVDGKAQRPGDIVRSMKGDTVEVNNTDAEGRLVLADVLWYAQERFSPRGVVDLATLTGAIIIALGHEYAGVFANDDKFADGFLKAAREEGEGAWRMPLAPAFDKALKSNLADMQNVGGRPAGSITAAMFIKRFIKPDMPWIHLDIAGVASRKDATDLAPKGATGWGVLALDRMIAETVER